MRVPRFVDAAQEGDLLLFIVDFDDGDFAA